MNSKTKIIVTALVGVGVLGLALMFGFKPLLSGVRELNSGLSVKQAELDEITKQILEFKTAQSDLAKATYKTDVSDTIVIKEDLATVITQLETAAALTGTDESIQIQEAATARVTEAPATFGGLALSEEVSYTMSVKNDFEGLVEFFQYLEHMLHFTEFKSFTLNSVTDTIRPEQGGGVSNNGTIQGNVQGSFLVESSPDSNPPVPAE